MTSTNEKTQYELLMELAEDIRKRQKIRLRKEKLKEIEKI